jgi:RNA polymerase sigma-70 factor, ECF subfamily
MNETSLSLLDRVSDSPHSESWNELVTIYRPLLERWLRRYHVQESDADDLVQEVLTVVVRELPNFRHNQRVGAFRNWLRTILANRLKEYWRSGRNRPQSVGGSEFVAQLHELEDGNSCVSRIWNEEHDAYLMQRLCQKVRNRFDAKTWEAFERQVIGGQRAGQAAEKLGLSLSSVYAAKSRVLHALRQESQGLIDAF